MYYDLTKFRPAHGNVDSSTTFVLRFNEIPAGSRKRRFQYYICTTISRNSGRLTEASIPVLHMTTIQRNSGRLTETSIPVLHLYYGFTKFRPAHGSVDSSTTYVQRFNEIPAGSRKRRFQYYICTTISRNSGRLTEASIPVLHLYNDSTKFRPAHGNVDSSTKLVLRFHEIPAGSRKRRFQYYICTTI